MNLAHAPVDPSAATPHLQRNRPDRGHAAERRSPGDLTTLPRRTIAPTEGPIRLLLIEDEPADATWVRRSLSRSPLADFEIEVVDHLAAGVARLRQQPFDAILLDLKLPDGAGLPAFQIIHDTAPHTPTVLFTGAWTDEPIAVEALQRGAEDYLRKGQIDGTMLARALLHAVSRQRWIQEPVRSLPGRSDFVATVSQEIRAPLGTIREGLSLLREGSLGPMTERQRHALQLCTRNAQRLEATLLDLLDVAAIETETLALRWCRCEVSAIAREVAERFALLARRRGLHIIVEPFAGTATQYADPERIDQLLTQLVGNALTWTPHGAVTIATQVNGTHLHLTVTDTGRGLSPEQLAHLFDPIRLRRVLPATPTHGLDLGWYLAGGIARAHGGAIDVTSTPDTGTRVTVTLPRHTARSACLSLVTHALRAPHTPPIPLCVLHLEYGAGFRATDMVSPAHLKLLERTLRVHHPQPIDIVTGPGAHVYAVIHQGTSLEASTLVPVMTETLQRVVPAHVQAALTTARVRMASYPGDAETAATLLDQAGVV